LSVKINEALRLPVAEGVKVTVSAQVLFGVRVAPVHLSALVPNSVTFVPPTVTVEMVRLAVPVLVTVTVWVALGVSRLCGPNVRLRGKRPTKGAGPPIEILATNALPCPPRLVAWSGSTVGKSVESVYPAT
jgi:hypothetical protein